MRMKHVGLYSQRSIVWSTFKRILMMAMLQAASAAARTVQKCETDFVHQNQLKQQQHYYLNR